MSVNFIKSGDKVFVEKLPEGIRTESLKAKLYSIEFTKDTGFYLLEIADKYTLPEKTYGNYKKAAERVIETHNRKLGNTGILLTGIKGTGKTLFMKFIANQLLEQNTPVIQVNKPYHGEEIFNFVENIGNCAIIFDEFGKNYKNYDNGNGLPTQVGLLSLLDGLGNHKRMHLFTENELSTISEYLINRPGRVHYHFKYSRLTDEIIREFCVDKGVPEDIILELLQLATKMRVLSFDTISCLVNEWLYYGGKLEDHIHILNVSLLRNPDKEDVEVVSYVDATGKEIPASDVKANMRDNFFTLMVDTKVEGYNRFHHTEHTGLEEAITVEGNLYKFIGRGGERYTLRLN